MGLKDIRILKQFIDDNSKLKRLVAELILAKEILHDILWSKFLIWLWAFTAKRKSIGLESCKRYFPALSVFEASLQSNSNAL